MSGTQADRLAAWRAARSVTSVTSAFLEVVTLPETLKSAIVASVTSVADENVQAGDNVAARAALYLAAESAAPAPLRQGKRVDPLYLAGLAARLASAARAGAEVAPCPAGAIDVTRPDGRLWLISPTYAAALRADPAPTETPTLRPGPPPWPLPAALPPRWPD